MDKLYDIAFYLLIFCVSLDLPGREMVIYLKLYISIEVLSFTATSCIHSMQKYYLIPHYRTARNPGEFISKIFASMK